MKVYKTRIFDKWSKNERITEASLCRVVDEMLSGLIDADLGGGLIKKRLAKPGQGKRGGYRVLLAFKNNCRALFLTGFSKNEIDNIATSERDVFKELCMIYLKASQAEIDNLCKAKKLIEVNYETSKKESKI